MQRIVTYTKIHGNGNEVVINGIVNAELQRQRDMERKAYENEMEWMNMIKKQRDKMRKEKLKLLDAKPCMSWGKKAKEKIAFVWACLFCWGEALGLWEHEEGR